VVLLDDNYMEILLFVSFDSNYVSALIC